MDSEEARAINEWIKANQGNIQVRELVRMYENPAYELRLVSLDEEKEPKEYVRIEIQETRK